MTDDDLIVIEKNKKFGFINRKGEMVIPMGYSCAQAFENGIAKVKKIKNGVL